MTPARFLFLLFCVSALLTSCKRESDVVVAAREGILLLGNGAEPATLDPQVATGVPEHNILGALMEGLTNHSPTKDFVMDPGVAESWEHVDHRIWTFQLRADAKWSNGDPVTAKDFMFSWQRILEPALASQYAQMLYLMKGARAYNKGDLKDFSQVGCKAVDERTIEIELIEPTPFFPQFLGHYSWFPVHEATVRAHGEVYDLNNPWAKEGRFVGNGAFNLSEWKMSQLIRVTKSETYWDRANVALNEVHFFPIENENTEERAFQGGQLHATSILPLAKIPVYRDEYPEFFRSDPNYATYFYRINVTEKVLENREIRHALSLAIDRQQLVEKLLNGSPRPATGLVPSGLEGYKTAEQLRFDPEYAANVLAKAGYPNGEGFPPMEILINTMEAHRQIAEVIQEMWRNHLGIEVTIRNEAWKVYLESQRLKKYQISRAGWNADYLDPTTFLEMFIKDGGNNNTGWSSAPYERLLDQARSETDPARRFAILGQAEELLLNEMPIIPIYWYTRVRAVRPEVEGWNSSLIDTHPLKHVSLKGAAVATP